MRNYDSGYVNGGGAKRIDLETWREERPIARVARPRDEGEAAARIAELEAELARYRAFFEEAHDALADTNGQGVVRTANAQLGAILGVPPMFLRGKLLLNFVARADTRTFRNFVGGLGTGRRSDTVDVRLRPRDGSALFIADMRARVIHIGAARAILWCVRPRAAALHAAEEGTPESELAPSPPGV